MPIDLDNFDDEDFEVEDLEPEPASTKKQPKREAVNTGSIYEQYQNLMYAVDHSGSMNEPIASDDPADYEWPEGSLKEHVKRIFRNSFGITSPQIQEFMTAMEDMSDEEVQKAILLLGASSFDIHPKIGQTVTKLMLVKENIKDHVDRQFDKNPEARIQFLPFDHTAAVEAATRATIKDALNALQPAGGTNLTLAVVTALEYFEQYPSPVGINHLVLVTDGEDYGAIQIKNQVERMKELGVVFDYLYITARRSNGKVSESANAQMFKKICDDSGGKYVEVSSAGEFKQKFFEAATRLCLPPGV